MSTSFLDQLYSFRDTLAYFWNNPGVIKSELITNHQLLVEVIAALVVLILLIFILLKPSKSKKKLTVITNQSKTKAEPKSEAITPKTFSRALSEQQKQEPTIRSKQQKNPKKPSAPLYELSTEEELAFKRGHGHSRKTSFS